MERQRASESGRECVCEREREREREREGGRERERRGGGGGREREREERERGGGGEARTRMEDKEDEWKTRNSAKDCWKKTKILPQADGRSALTRRKSQTCRGSQHTPAHHCCPQLDSWTEQVAVRQMFGNCDTCPRTTSNFLKKAKKKKQREKTEKKASQAK